MTAENDNFEKDPDINVLGEEMTPCGLNPVTGFFRDGCCATGPNDIGRHVVCAEVTQDFLEYSHLRGNDLMTPQPAFGFPGLKPGDKWCLCADRWQEALEAGCAPPVFLQSTHQKALEYVNLADLKAHARDLA